MDRRGFLKAMGVLALPAPLLAFPDEARAARFDYVREINLIRRATGERQTIPYWYQGRYIPEGLVWIDHFFRDVRDNGAKAHISRPLIDILAWMQAWFKLYGYDKPILLNSGYRTERTNNRLIPEGAAKNSLHTKGRAADITLPGVPSNYLGQLCLRLQQGGVGIYDNQSTGGFVHVDDGRIRSWRG